MKMVTYRCSVHGDTTFTARQLRSWRIAPICERVDDDGFCGRTMSQPPAIPDQEDTRPPADHSECDLPCDLPDEAHRA